MIVVLWICMAILVAAMLLALWAIGRGPTSMERSIALDVLSACLIGFLVVVMAASGRPDVLSLLVVLSTVGFVGTTAVARFVRPRGQTSKSNELSAIQGQRGAKRNALKSRKTMTSKTTGQIMPETGELDEF